MILFKSTQKTKDKIEKQRASFSITFYVLPVKIIAF